MRTVVFGGNIVEIYDSIENLPPSRESKMNYYALSEYGIGHDWKSIEDHLNGIVMAAHQAAKYPEKMPVLAQEVENLKLNYITMASQYNPKHLSWLCLVHSINGEPLTDLSETNLLEKAKFLSETSDAEYAWEDVFEEVKKKFPTSWQLAFQSGQQETTEQDFLSDLLSQE